jgi:hypothetical protein
MSDFESSEIKRLMREDQRRGTKARLPNEEALLERKIRVADMRELLKQKDRKEFRRILIDDYELPEKSERLVRALRTWDEHYRDKKS